MQERRGSPRVVLDGHLVTLASTVDVQVIDISENGVRLHTGQALEAGTKGSLRLNLWNVPFIAEVEVRWVAPVVASGLETGFEAGAVFVAITPGHRQLIEHFASQ